MKALSIQQPWGALICCGLKDVENRKWELKSTPLRVLIHVGAKRQNIDETNMPLIWANPIENAQIMGVIGPLKELPTSAVIGVATIDRCEEGNESIWAMRGEGAEYQWLMKDVCLFKEPITGVKGKLGIFDIPEITPQNMPAFVDVPEIVREGTHIEIPLCKEMFDQIDNDAADTIYLNLTEDNKHLFCDEELNALETKTATFFCGDDAFDCNVIEYAIEPVSYDGTNEEPAEFEDALGRKYHWYQVAIRVE